jgi:branched-chain amino acid transport system ATP-binding protein
MPAKSFAKVIRKPSSATRKCRGHILAIKLDIQNVHAGYGAVRALMGVSLELSQGQTVVLLGTNGNGKSTLMKCIMGMVKPDSGSIRLDIDGQQHDLTQMSTEDIVNLGVALVPEGRRLFPKLTVEENLFLGAFRPLARQQIASNLEFAFDAFPLLKERRKQLAGSMSGGQQQMLAIARALMSAPKVLLVDEPSVGLSPLLVSQTITKLKELKEKYHLTVLMAEQNFNQATRIADHGYIIVHGEIVFQGDVESIKNNEMVKSFYLGAVAH